MGNEIGFGCWGLAHAQMVAVPSHDFPNLLHKPVFAVRVKHAGNFRTAKPPISGVVERSAVAQRKGRVAEPVASKHSLIVARCEARQARFFGLPKLAPKNVFQFGVLDAFKQS